MSNVNKNAGHGRFVDPAPGVAIEHIQNQERQRHQLAVQMVRVGLDKIPASGRFDMATVDKALAGKSIGQRMELKGRLRQFGLIDA